MQTISNKPTCTLCQFQDWLKISLSAGGVGAASSVAGGQDPVLRHFGFTGRLV